MLLCTPLAFYLPSCSFSGLSRKLPPSLFSFSLVSFTSLSLCMGTIFQIVSSALCSFSHRNYLPSLILWNARGFLSLFKPLRKALKHCPRSSGPLHPLHAPPHPQWLLRYSLWHCRTQPPSVRNTLSPDREVPLSPPLRYGWCLGKLQKFRNSTFFRNFLFWRCGLKHLWFHLMGLTFLNWTQRGFSLVRMRDVTQKVSPGKSALPL